MSNFLIPISLARLSPSMSASYLALLFVALKPHHIAYWIRSPLGEVRTRPMPAPLTLLNPSTVTVHLELEHSVKLRSSLPASGVTFGAKFAMKSANTCDLRAVRG